VGRFGNSDPIVRSVMDNGLVTRDGAWRVPAASELENDRYVQVTMGQRSSMA
jgi:hypothetical protein